MPRIPVHTRATVPENSSDLIEMLERKHGKLLNIHAKMADSPAVIAAYDGISRAIATYGTLDARTREAIALAVGHENDCTYCQAAHTGSARRAGFSVEETVAIRANAIDFDDKLAALTDLVRESARNTGSVSPETWERALSAGWTQAELSETFVHLAINLYTNFFNHYAETELDVPAAPQLP
ncbi:AhpD family alkylhydroperoxidase [Mycetocola sp. CAN_C7]|uniref:carboxymuconolactone decarboxylase family protein n=1 Tax=Mycetocola sp. CAN_C7 TaxID=2787724 RepID=UPI0018CB26D6